MSAAGTTAGGPADDNYMNQKVYSSCPKVRQVVLQKGVSKDLPMLIVLINSFLHFQVSNEMLQNFAISSIFQSVICHFSELGPVARLYLLKTKTLNRLLRIVVQS